MIELKSVVARHDGTAAKRDRQQGPHGHAARRPNCGRRWSTRRRSNWCSLNLVLNARDAMPGGGTLTIATGNASAPARRSGADDPPEGDYVAISVRDTGTGMTPEVLARAFEPFFTTKAAGRRLGAWPVAGVRRWRGNPAAACGSTARRARHRRACATCRRDAAAAEQPARRAGRRRTRTATAANVLVVDDDEAVRSTTAMVLRDPGLRA